MASQEWFYNSQGKSIGPISPKELKDLAEQNLIVRDTNVRLGHNGDWMLAERVTGLFPKNVPVTESAGVLPRPVRVKPDGDDWITDVAATFLQVAGIGTCALAAISIGIFMTMPIEGIRIIDASVMAISAGISGLVLTTFAGGVRALLKIAGKG